MVVLAILGLVLANASGQGTDTDGYPTGPSPWLIATMLLPAAWATLSALRRTCGWLVEWADPDRRLVARWLLDGGPVVELAVDGGPRIAPGAGFALPGAPTAPAHAAWNMVPGSSAHPAIGLGITAVGLGIKAVVAAAQAPGVIADRKRRVRERDEFAAQVHMEVLARLQALYELYQTHALRRGRGSARAAALLEVTDAAVAHLRQVGPQHR